MRLADPGADQNGKRLKFERARIIGAKQGPVSLQFLNRLSRNGRDLDGALVHDRLELFQRREGSALYFASSSPCCSVTVNSPLRFRFLSFK